MAILPSLRMEVGNDEVAGQIIGKVPEEAGGGRNGKSGILIGCSTSWS